MLLLKDEVEQIATSALQCVHDAGILCQDIDLIILTGGSTEIPAVQLKFKELFPNGTISEENKLDSVGIGLAYDSKRKFLEGVSAIQ